MDKQTTCGGNQTGCMTVYHHDCPNCGGKEILFIEEVYICGACGMEHKDRDIPRATKLERRIAKLEAENAILTAELAELNNKAVFIQFENEDELPADISSDIYSAMFNCSHVDVVRLFPYIKENGQKYYLVMLREDE